MKEFKEQMNKAFRALVMMEDKWDKLDSHERETVYQVAQETGFDELGNFEEVVDKFKQFYLQMQRTTVIDGYQVYLDSTGRINIIVQNGEWNLGGIGEIKMATKEGYPKEIPTETMLKILEWYIEEE